MLNRIEVCTVAVVAAILLAIIVPAVFVARENARETQCVGQMHNLCIGLLGYQSVHDSFPYGAIGNSQWPVERRWSWYPELLPWIQQAASPPIDYLTDSRDSRNWPLVYPVEKGEHRFNVRLQAPTGVTCPNGYSDAGEHGQVYAGYVGVAGIGPASATSVSNNTNAGIWGFERSTSNSQIRGKRNATLLLIEAESDRDVWLFAGHPTVRWLTSAHEPQIGAGRSFGNFHRNVAIAGMADGRVRRLSVDIEPKLFAELACISPVP